jgi:hypothetical protein
MTTLKTLADHLAAEQTADDAVKDVVAVIAQACVQISKVVASGAISGSLGAAGQVNVQDEEQKKLDIITNDILRDALKACPAVAGLASEELEEIETTGRVGGFLITFDPLDGSSNIDVNVSVGTIFSILPAPAGHEPTEADFLLPGRQQVAAGYVVYGPQTMLVLTVAKGVFGFTMSADGEWLLTHETVTIGADTAEFAINMSNQRHWAAAGAPLYRRLPGRQDRSARQELQHALGGLDGRRRPPHPDARRHLPVPVGRPRAGQARQAAPAVRSQSDVADRRAGRGQGHRRQDGYPRSAADQAAPAGASGAGLGQRGRSGRGAERRLGRCDRD